MLTFENSLSDFFGSGWEYYVLTGLVSIVIVFILCRFFLLGLSKAFESLCDWLEYKLARRRARRTCFSGCRKNNRSAQDGGQINHNAVSKAATKKTTSLSTSRKGRIIDAQNVLRRNAEAYSNRHEK